MANAHPQTNVDEAVQETVRKVAAETGRTGRVMADVGERAVCAQAELLSRNAEALQHVVQSGSELATRLTNRSADRFAKALGIGGDGAESALQQSSRNLNSVVQSSATLSHGMHAISNEWLTFMRQRAEQYLDHVDALMRCRTPQEFVALQSDMVRDHLTGIIATTRRAADLSAETADAASRKLADAAESAGRAA